MKSMLWVELFNLSEESGITFPVTQAHGCGGFIDRVQFVEDGPFYSLPLDTGDGVYTVDGKTYSDICCTRSPMKHLVKLDREKLALVEF